MVEEDDKATPTQKRTKAQRRAAHRAAIDAARQAKADQLAISAHRPDNRLIIRNRLGQIEGHKLNQRQDDLAVLLAAGVPQGMAGRLTGYTSGSGDASRASNSPAVRARVLDLQRKAMGRLAPLATRLVRDIITGQVTAPAATRLDAAKYVHKIAGVDQDDNKANEQKDLRAMSLEELERIAAVFRDKTEPARPGDDAQVIDIAVESTT